ncbi:GATOR complex protein NPRL2-like isoform X2 [Pectinophora gossypiella]|uniref:GATOR complex protein NPRL2-like isoform X2 n=1 Tax=Pectinophora gossypiella TaxID=13191 RepID=UPI00214EDF39|nr:GATOR complex protein NPRL2-like isoform X2 [Pectinophora gossypiella]
MQQSNAFVQHGYEDSVDAKFGLMSGKVMETRYYEGCGREGPIRCIFLGEFHPVAGPKIACQFPEDYISKEVFDTISAYIIPKPQIQKCTMTINALGHKIVGYPIRIDNSRYERNVYLFNLCFVCDSWSKTVQYEPVVKKLGEHLTIMEEETRFVSSGSTKLPTLLAHLLHDLNTHRKATLVGDTVMHLKVLEVRKDPPVVHDHDVPVLVASVGLPRPGRPPRIVPPEGTETIQSQEHLDFEDEEPFEVDMEADWDLTTRQLLPYINGYNHVSKIAADTKVEKTLVKSCIQNLVYYGVVTLIPVLKFSNMYRATPNLSRLFSDQELQKSCIAFITKGSDSKEKPIVSDVLEILCALQQGTTLRTVCERFSNTLNPSFDIRRLVVFAQLHGLIKCLKRYPVYIRSPPRPNGFIRRVDSMQGIRRLFTGRHCTDEICCLGRIDLPTLDQIIEDDPNVAIIWR